MKRAYISVINDLATDQRLGRVAKLLGQQGFEVTCIGRRLRGSPIPEGRSFRHIRFRMLFTKGALFYACYNTRLFFTLLFARNPDLFISNDLDTLPASFMAGRIRRVPLIYDSHELFTQVPELLDRKTIQSIWKWIEHSMLPKLAFAVTVNYSIATIYRRLYGTRFRVVRNVPEKLDVGQRKVNPEGQQLIIYQGSLNVGRGLELIIDAMQYLPEVHLLVAGTGDIEKELRKRVAFRHLEERVEFAGRVLPGDLTELTMRADLGVSLEEDLGLNYRYALPNKIFDYIQCRVPVLCSDLPEMSRIVDSYGVGISTRERDPEKIAGIVRYMLKERSGGAWMEALEKAALELCWEKESEVYLELLKDCGVLD